MSETQAFQVSSSAARRIREILATEAGAAPYFRLAVTGGGCSGFQYNFSLDDRRNADDLCIETDGVTVLVDETSLDLVRGSMLDFVEELIGASFQVKNPNATSRCGCGTSFAV